mmetsp:Transcript_184/g.478  ORF Transcript_184/g.478 Transcript_184/m.478 type:complete len:353 (+) Transcript_184:209-1267(+)
MRWPVRGLRRAPLGTVRVSGALLSRLVGVPVHLAADPVVVGDHLAGAHGHHGEVLVVDVLHARRLDVLGGDGVDAREQLRLGDAAAIGEHLAADVLRHGAGAVQVQRQRRLDGVLCANHILLLHGVAEGGELAHHAPDEVLEVLPPGGDGADAEEAGVGVVGVERHVAVREPVGGDALPEGGGHVDAGGGVLVPRAQHRLHHHQRHRVGVRPGGALDGDGEVALGHVVVAEADLGAGEDGRVGLDDLCGGLAAGGELGELGLHLLHQGVVVHGARAHHHHALRGVVGGDVLRQVLLANRADVLRRAQDAAAQRAVLEGGGVQVVEEHLLGDTLHLLHLAKDDVPLVLDAALI